MRLVVLDAATLGKDVSLREWEQFGQLTVYETTSPDQMLERMSGHAVVILNKAVVEDALLSKLPELKLICITATGYDNIDIAACRKRGIAVCNVTGYSTHSVAQVTLAMALSLMTHLPEYAESVRSGLYTAAGVQNRLEPVYHEFCGKTWGIVGLGNIGRQVARVADAMGCRVIGYKRKPDDIYPVLPLQALCKTADIISVHLPLTPETNHIIGAAELAVMKRDAILINVARGAVVDEAAVVTALERGELGGFGTDVYAPEPLQKRSPLWRVLDRPNVLATPHMAWGAYESRMRCIHEITENIKAFFRGETRNRVDQ